MDNPAGPDPENLYGGRPPLAETLVAYGTPTVARGSGDWVTKISSGKTSIVNSFVAVRFSESVTVISNSGLPAVVGLPLRTPSCERTKPPGPDPLHRYGGMPPAAANDAEYCTATVPGGSGDRVVISSGATTRTERSFVAVFLSASVTVTETWKVPGAVGVPDIAPAEFMLRPPGSPADDQT
jgi:hypothetical protein